jgi:hypothetical protein
MPAMLLRRSSGMGWAMAVMDDVGTGLPKK